MSLPVCFTERERERERERAKVHCSAVQYIATKRIDDTVAMSFSSNPGHIFILEKPIFCSFVEGEEERGFQNH